MYVEICIRSRTRSITQAMHAIAYSSDARFCDLMSNHKLAQASSLTYTMECTANDGTEHTVIFSHDRIDILADSCCTCYSLTFNEPGSRISYIGKFSDFMSHKIIRKIRIFSPVTGARVREASSVVERGIPEFIAWYSLKVPPALAKFSMTAAWMKRVMNYNKSLVK